MSTPASTNDLQTEMPGSRCFMNNSAISWRYWTNIGPRRRAVRRRAPWPPRQGRHRNPRRMNVEGKDLDTERPGGLDRGLVEPEWAKACSVEKACPGEPWDCRLQELQLLP